MKVKVSCQEGVSYSVVCDILSNAFGFNLQDCQEKFRTQGFLELNLTDDELEKLKTITGEYSYISIEVFEEREERIPVMIKLRSKGFPANMACNILAGIIGERLDNCVEALQNNEAIFTELKKDVAFRLLNSTKEYPFLEVKLLAQNLSIPTSSSDADSSIFTKSWELLKRNPGFYAGVGFAYILLLLLSNLPILGFLFNFVLGVFLYVVVLYIAVNYLESGYQIGELQFSKIKNYVETSVGINLGSLVLLFISGLVFSVLLIFSGGLGFISDIISHGRVIDPEDSPGMLVGIIISILLVLFLSLYYLYALLLIYSRAILKGLGFGQGFLSVFYPFSPEGFREAFSNVYFKLSMYLMMVFTVGIILAVLSAITIILLPVTAILVLWMITYFSITIGEYLRRNYKLTL